MSETYMPLWNIYEIEEEEGTHTLDTTLKTVLDNAEILLCGFKLLKKKWATTTTTTSFTPSSDEATVSVTQKVIVGDPYFIGEDYKLTFTSSSYTLEKI